MNSSEDLAACKKILVVSHDAGGAALLSAWLARHHPVSNCDFCLEGPAAEIFQARFPRMHRIKRHDIDVNHYDLILTSTSCAKTALEREVIRAARRQNIRVISALDHWTNYRLRFLCVDNIYLPDEIWVFDEFAMQIAKQELSGANIRLQENVFLKEQAENIASMRRLYEQHEGLQILYVSEPSNSHVYSEFDALSLFLEFLSENAAGLPEKITLRIRLHPREERGKYDTFINLMARELMVETSSASLAEDIAWADWVIGCQTMAMVVALAASKQVYSIMPGWVDKIALPHNNIERLFIPNALEKGR